MSDEVIYNKDEREALSILGKAALIYHYKIMAPRSDNVSFTKIPDSGLGVIVGKVEYLEKFTEFIESEGT